MPTQFDFWAVFAIGAVIALSILLMSTFFLVKAIRRAKAIGMDKKKITTAVRSSAIFSIVPSIPIVIGIGVMMSFLGLAIPWIRLTVIGALQYEIIAMDQVGLTTAEVITPELIATALVIMTISILSGPLFNLFFYKKYQSKLGELGQNNKKLLDTITGSLLGGMMAGLASYIIMSAIFTNILPAQASTSGITTSTANGYITLITLGASVVIMALCGLLMKVFKWKWIENYALPITMVASMAIAYGLTFVPAFA